MTRKTQSQTADSFHLGDRVRIKDLSGQIGRITELRGPLGPGGAPVYRVKVSKKPRNSYIELLGDQLERLPLTTTMPSHMVQFRRPKAVSKVTKTSKTTTGG